MTGFLGGLFERKSASGGQAVSRAVSNSPSRYGYWASTGPWDMDKAVTDGWEKVLWVFRCVDAIAVNQASLKMLHRKGDPRTGNIIDNPQLMKMLNTRPNIYETAAMFRYRLTTNLLLSRKGAFIEIVGDPKSPESLHILPPQMVEPIPHPTKYVEGYRVRGADMSETTLKPEQVIWIRVKPHPTDPYAQTTPLVSAGITAETDYLARMFNRNFLLADGRPGLLVSVRGQVSPDDALELKRRFSGGPSQAGQTSIIEGDGLDVVDLGSNPRDAQWQEATRTSKEDILLAFGVPESVMGNASGRTFDNADAEYEGFWLHTMKPHCDAIAASFDVFTGDLTDDNVIAYDYDAIEVLQRHENIRKDNIVTRFQQGAITWNEMREGLGLEMWPEALAARIIVLPSGIAMAKDGKDQAGIMDLPNVQNPAGPGEAMSEIARQGALQGSREGQRKFANILSARALQLAGKSAQVSAEQIKEDDVVPFDQGQYPVLEAALVHPYDEQRKTLEATLDGVLIGLSSRQETVIGDRLMHAKVRKGTRHWDGETKATKPLDPSYAVETDRWVSEVRDDFLRVLRAPVMREAKRVLRDMTDNGLADVEGVTLEKLVQQTLTEVLGVAESSTRNMSQRLSDTIHRMDDEGASIDEIKTAIKKSISTRSSWRKGLTGHVTTSAYEGIKHAVYSQAKGKVRKTWNTEDDERVRESHRWLDGETIKSHELFHMENTMLRYPGDPLGSIEEVAGCRCWLTYQVK